MLVITKKQQVDNGMLSEWFELAHLSNGEVDKVRTPSTSLIGEAAIAACLIPGWDEDDKPNTPETVIEETVFNSFDDFKKAGWCDEVCFAAKQCYFITPSQLSSL